MSPLFQNFISSFFAPFQGETFLSTLSLVWSLAPIWAPIATGGLFWYLWKNYTLVLFLKNQKMILLELKIPPEVFKTPYAMELVLSAIHFTFGETTIIDRLWLGKRRAYFTFEIVSIGGQIRFYIYTRAFLRNHIEAAFYAQYPEIEIHEAEDYSLPFEYVPGGQLAVWGCEFMKTRKAKNGRPQDFYPIKTYVDYGLESTLLKEEQKVDPMTPLLETLAMCRPGHNLWIQILFQAHRKDLIKSGTLFQKVDWTDEANREIDNVLKRAGAVNLSPSGFPILPQLSDEERKKVTSIERNIAKLAFNVGIRCVYLTDQEVNGVHIVGLLNCLKQFNAPDKNGLQFGRWHAEWDWPWQDFRDIRAQHRSKKLLEYYKRRAYFYPPYQQKFFVMSTEEFATLFHIPGTSASTPSMARLTSRRAEPPANLPI